MVGRIHFFQPQGHQMRGTLEAAFPGREIVILEDKATFEAELPEMAFLLAGRPPIQDLSAARSLRLLQSVGAGIDHLAGMRNIPPKVQVANASGVSADPIAEFALTLAMMLFKNMQFAMANQNQRRWRMVRSRLLEDSTMTILGCGKIGQALARRAVALGMRVVGTQRKPKPAPNVAHMYGMDETAQALAEADVAVCILPLTEQTRGFLDERLLRALKRGALFVNVGRGGVIDEDALAALLGDGHITSAAMDVFAQEPLPAVSPLWQLPNLLITSHSAGYYPDYFARLVTLFAANVKAVEDGKPLHTPVDLEAGY